MKSELKFKKNKRFPFELEIYPIKPSALQAFPMSGDYPFKNNAAPSHALVMHILRHCAFTSPLLYA
jgi:hypothetical protein